MKFSKARYVPFFTLATSLLGLALRVVLNCFGTDEKGLLISAHPAGIGLFVLTALVMAALFLGCSKLQKVRSYTRLFPASVTGLLGCILAAAGIGYSAASRLLEQQDSFSLMIGVLALLCAVCLVLLGICRLKGRQPHYLFHACLTVYLMAQLISEYRYWSPEPQLLLYFFPLLAMVFLMLTAYQATCLDAGQGNRCRYAFFNQAAVFFCCVSLPGDHWVFYLSMGLWAGTNLCSLRTFKERSTEHKEA